MRIVGGRHRGTALAAVGTGDKGAALRPTSDRVREALFNVLSGGRYGDPITGARVLDLLVDMRADEHTTLVLVTHDDAVAAQAERRIYLEAGRVAREEARA